MIADHKATKEQTGKPINNLKDPTRIIIIEINRYVIFITRTE